MGIKLASNVARANLEDGIAIFHGSAGRLTRNTTERNGDHGIVAGAANKTVVTRNSALNNGNGSPDPISRDDVIRGIVAADASDAEIRPTRDPRQRNRARIVDRPTRRLGEVARRLDAGVLRRLDL